jgi:cytochrome c-type biogenesis protein CcmH/NrfF
VRRAAAALAACLALAGAVPAMAAACPKTSLGDIEDEVMCPVCGTSLELASEAPQAQRERAFIERLIADCKSKEEVKSALAAEFGDEVLALPEGDGFEIAAYLVPAAVLLSAAAAIALGVRRWRRAGAGNGQGGGSTPSGDGDRAAGERLDDDLARYDL